MISFTDDFTKKNIEVGAGNGDFGQRYYPQCYLTDYDQSLKSSRTKIDCFCDAHNLIYWNNDRFEHVIMCNPFGYGFSETDSSEALLDELIRVLKNKGKIVILGNKTNKFCAPQRIEKRLNNYVRDHVHLKFEVNDIDAKSLYGDYKFWSCDGFEVIPTKKIEIYVTK